MAGLLTKAFVFAEPLKMIGIGGGIALLVLIGFVQSQDSSKAIKMAWLVVASALACPILILIWVHTLVEWNPAVARQDVVGVWRDDDYRIELMADGTYRQGGQVGSWRIRASNALELAPTPQGFPEPLFFAYNGDLHLRRDSADDTARYRDLGMSKVPE